MCELFEMLDTYNCIMDTCACFETYVEKSSPVAWGIESLALLQTEVKGEGLTKREGCGQRVGPGCGPLLGACTGAGKCQEPALQRS